MADKTPEVKTEATPVVEAPKAEKLVEVELTTQFRTNDDVYGEPESEDENGPIYTTVHVSKDIADDLIRRQKAFDRMKRELVASRSVGRFQ